MSGWRRGGIRAYVMVGVSPTEPIPDLVTLKNSDSSLVVLATRTMNYVAGEFFRGRIITMDLREEWCRAGVVMLNPDGQIEQGPLFDVQAAPR